MTNALTAIIPHQLTPKFTQPVLVFQYADDTIFLLSVKGPTIRSLLLVIHCFSATSGMQVNFAKSAFIPFSIPDTSLQDIQLLLQCQAQSLPISYLGMPLTLRAPTRADFTPLLQKLKYKLEGWRARLLSRGGRLQLIKSVLSAIPMYYMACFRLPRWLIDRMDAIRRTFLWSKPQAVKAIPLLNWKTVCLPIECGGLGVMDLRLQNMSLLLRWWWNLFSPDCTLWKQYASLLNALRSPQPSPIILTSRGSFFWNSISTLRPLFHSCSQFQIVSGKNISFWHDRWDGLPLIYDKKGNVSHRNISLAEARHRLWDLFEAPLTHAHHLAFQKLSALNPGHGPDRLIWTISSSGLFSVKSVYKILSQGGKIRSPITAIWKIKVPPTVRVFFLLLLKNRTLTHDNMLRRHLPYTPGCVMCPQNTVCQAETCIHLFFQCPFASQIWTSLSFNVGYPVAQLRDSVIDTYQASIPKDANLTDKWATLFITATWLIWKERNCRTFRLKSTSASIILGKILHETELYLRYC